jgi:DNA invertase Pin-like site-specific DNA recombinase
MRVAIYARVSTDKQDTELQLTELREYAVRRGWEAIEYTDSGVSGAKENRPQLDRLMADANRRKFGAVVVWKFDRFARSTQHLLKALTTFRELGVEFISLREAIDTSTTVGKMVFTFLAAVAEFEREIITERVRAGVARAKAKGHVAGPKPMQLNMDAITERRAAGESLRAIARSLGVSPALLVKRAKAGVP